MASWMTCCDNFRLAGSIMSLILPTPTFDSFHRPRCRLFDMATDKNSDPIGMLLRAPVEPATALLLLVAVALALAAVSVVASALTVKLYM